MDIDLRPTSELEAVNMMLATIGESPVNTIEDNGVVDAVLARQILLSTSRRVQARGWLWNTDKNLELPLTFPDKHVYVPAGTLKIDAVGPSGDLDVSIRGRRLYNRVTHSYAFEQTVVVDAVVMLAFEELPETARQYLAITAARKFQESVVGSETLGKFNQREEIIAWADLVNEEGENADYNILTGMEALAR